MQQISEPTLRAFFLGLAAVSLGIGLWMFLLPHSFYTTVGAFEAYNRHYERDAATFYFAFALGAYFAALRPSWRIPVLSMVTLQYLIHTINHGIDAGHANNSWAGPVDVASLALATIQFAGLLWLLQRRQGAAR
ncbi:MAG: hypothetical protein ACR2ND_09090 [Solirubrobacteraceae bacterium]